MWPSAGDFYSSDKNICPIEIIRRIYFTYRIKLAMLKAVYILGRF
jgi:hypothetical protein